MDKSTHTNVETPTLPIWSFKDLIIILAGIVFIFIAGFGIMGLFLSFQNVTQDQALEPSITQSLVLAALEAIALIGGVYLFGIRRKHTGWASVGLKKASFGWLLTAFVTTAIAIPVSGVITLIVLLAFGMPLDNPQLDFLLPEDLTGIQVVAMIFLAGIIAPFGEEIVFRGVLYQFLRNKWGITLGVIVSSLIFGLIHGNIAVGLTAFLLGILLAIFFEYSRSLWTSVLIHSVNNSARLVLLYFVLRSGLIPGLGL